MAPSPGHPTIDPQTTAVPRSMQENVGQPGKHPAHAIPNIYPDTSPVPHLLGRTPCKIAVGLMQSACTGF